MNPDQKNKVAWITYRMTDAGEAFSLCFLFTGVPPSPVPASPEAVGRHFIPRTFSQFHFNFIFNQIHSYLPINYSLNYGVLPKKYIFKKCESDS